METPNYIKSLLLPSNGDKPRARRVWGIDLELVWLPFFTATNTNGDTAIPADALGSPIRLGYNPDGSVKFSKTGRPITKVVKDISDAVRLVRDNFTANLLSYAQSVATDNPDGFKAMVETAKEAGAPIIAKDRANLDRAMAEAMAEAVEGKGKRKQRVAVSA